MSYAQLEKRHVEAYQKQFATSSLILPTEDVYKRQNVFFAQSSCLAGMECKRSQPFRSLFSCLLYTSLLNAVSIKISHQSCILEFYLLEVGAY